MGRKRRRQVIVSGVTAITAAIPGCSRAKDTIIGEPSDHSRSSEPNSSLQTQSPTDAGTETVTTTPRPDIGSWPTNRYDNSNTAYNPNSGAFGINSGSLQVKWSSPKLGGDPGAVVNEGLIITSSTEGFHVLDQNGNVVNQLGGRRGSGNLAYKNGILYSIYDDHRIGVFGDVDGDSETLATTYNRAGEYYGPAPTENGVVATQELGMVFCYDDESGEEKWNVAFSAISHEDDEAKCGPAVSGDSVYVVTRGGHVASIGLADGELKWTKETGGNNLKTPPVVTDGRVFVVSDKLLALNSSSGDVVWESDKRTNLLGGISPAVTDKYIYQPSGDGLSALDLTDGSLEWTFETRTSPVGPISDGSNVYYLSGESTPDHHRTIHVLDADDGTELGSLKKLNTPGDEFTQSVFRGFSGIAGGVIFVNGFNRIHAVNAD